MGVGFLAEVAPPVAGAALVGGFAADGTGFFAGVDTVDPATDGAFLLAKFWAFGCERIGFLDPIAE